ncbi:MAG: GNAT family N-acetyltransferase [Betaproteobacteria bacterium]
MPAPASALHQAGGLLWTTAAFDDLSTRGLYALLQLRSQVFVVEQNCVFLDMDDADAQAMHLLGWRGDSLVAYARCFAPGIKFTEASIGRIAIRMSARGTGLGHQLVQRSIALVSATWGRQAIRIGAQAQLKLFYQGHGFDDMGLPYVEDGIDHLEMIWRP